MTRILILYGTTDGHTRKIAEAIAETLRQEECSVEVFEAAAVPPPPGPRQYDGVIVAASVHVGGYQRAVKRWVRAHAEGLNRSATAFVSVCLAVLERRPEVEQELGEIMQRFFRRCAWRPTIHKVVAGAVPYTRYGWLKKWVMKRIVRKAGGGTDTTRDYEDTDWNDLRAFARAFAARLAVGQVIGGVR